MFNNVGKKIKTLSKVVFWLSMVLMVIMVLALIFSVSGQQGAQGSALMVLLPMLPSGAIMFVGIWLGALLMYGFGELIEKTQENNAYLAAMARNMEKE